MNNVLLGDCLKLLKDIPDKSIDMVLCDLPYEVTFLDWDKIIDIELLWLEYKRIRKPNTPILLFGQQPFTSYVVMSNLKDFKYQLIWKKEKASNVFNVPYQFGRIHEDICVFYKSQCTYNPQMKIRKNVTNPFPMKGDLNIDTSKKITGVYKHSKNYNPNITYPHSVLEFNRDSKKGKPALHPTQKPVALFEFLIRTFTNEGDVVLDNCAGSGTTAIACLNTDRNYILMEKEQKYYDIINDRIGKHKKSTQPTATKQFFKYE